MGAKVRKKFKVYGLKFKVFGVRAYFFLFPSLNPSFFLTFAAVLD